MSVSHQETFSFTGTAAQVCNGGIIQNVGDLFGTLCYCFLFYIWVVLSPLFPNHILVRVASTMVECVISWFSFLPAVKVFGACGGRNRCQEEMRRD